MIDQLPDFMRASVLHLGDGDRSVIDALTVNADHVAKVGANVADLIGGHTAWAAAGLPVARPDHSHLDSPSFDGQGFTELL